MSDIDTTLREIFTGTRTIACVGASPKPARPSHYVSVYLKAQGYRVLPVNPGQAGKRLFGEVVAGRLADLEAPVEMVDIFRRPEHVLSVVQEAIEHLPSLRVIWMQMGIRNEEAARLARAHGLTVIQDRCPMVEIPRLFGTARPLA
ncbi:hypothetical protein CLV78_10162 [Aliiruegeria haliotis]|uniref:CoA-binding domain-containing protein n=1 Tax=Aliiruegeria haliotis TaxID=1280846 RepID=A0A2T0RXS4_9RHOB|nr:CoA-binding protein [Aliiruegeria haliotis]PRY25971.1 hypothetical protein CLV78_10162 [Aliiruegeria haliotis]